MPKISGLELVRNLRSASVTLPVVLIGGNIPEQVKAQIPSLEIAATLLKRFGVPELLDIVKYAPLAVQPMASWSINSCNMCQNK
jgi:CheY-like chemotaxis protein